MTNYLKDFQEGTYNSYKGLINFRLESGETRDSIRNKLMEVIQRDIELLNKMTITESEKQLLIIEVNQILIFINELLAEHIYYTGKGKLNNNKVNYEYTEIYNYKILTPGSESCSYCITRYLKDVVNFKVDNREQKFIIDDKSNIYIIVL
jgi:hypothetical protein